MKAIPLKLDNTVYHEVEELSKVLQTPHNRYINKAVAHYNQMVKRELLAKQLAEESLSCREESMKVLSEFEQADEYHDQTRTGMVG
jgi:predicted transcriptional regulator